MRILLFLDILSEIFQLVFELGLFTRKHVIPAAVYLYVAAERYVYPAFLIPGIYLMVRRMRLAAS